MAKTQEKPNKSQMAGGLDEDGYKSASGSLPPLVLLEVGDGFKGKIDSVDIIKKEETVKKGGKKVVETKTRYFYRVFLDGDCEANDKNKERTKFGSGELVTLPGSGQIDNTMGDIALELEGKATEDGSIPNFGALHGLSIKVERKPDEKMKKGAFTGNKVKVYDIRWKKATA